MERRGLGRGLHALISGSYEQADASSVREVPLDRIEPNPYQPRQAFDPDRMEELTQSVREHGVLQPVLLRRSGVDTYEIIAGERRVRAARAAGLRAVPALVRDTPDPRMLEMALIENVQREDISPVEAAQAYRRLSDELGLTQQQIAERVGKAQPTIANTLRLLALPEPVLESLGRGEISEGHARALLQAGPEGQLAAWERIREEGLSVREAERLVRGMRGAAPGPGRRTAREAARPDPNLAAVEEALQVALGTKVRVVARRGIGRIEVEFYSMDELEGLVERILGPSSAH